MDGEQSPCQQEIECVTGNLAARQYWKKIRYQQGGVEGNE
jgi:hypothetical protein